MTIIDSEVISTAAEFWQSVGVPESFPRSLEPSVYLALPLIIVRLPRLHRSIAAAWLAKRRIPHPMANRGDEYLHGYLVARAGSAVIFLDGGDAPDEQRFSLAHEVAHFLNDYLRPRADVLRACGPGIQEVLDGRRSPSREEQLTGILRGVPLGDYFHVGRSARDPLQETAAVLRMEDRADQLALEMLAPIRNVIALLRSHVRLPLTDIARDQAVFLLSERYGLPLMIAGRYARAVLSELRSKQSIREWMGA